MKNYGIIICGCIMWMLVSCVQDAQLEEARLVSVEIDVKVEDNGVRLVGRLQNVGDWPIELIGFYLEREWQFSVFEKKIDLEKIELDVNGSFETLVDKNLYEGLSCKVYGYAIVGGRKYRSQSESFIAKGAAPMQVQRVELNPYRQPIRGELVVQGQNLSRFSDWIELKLDTTIVGYQNFRLKECTEERLVFEYSCAHIGTFPLRLQIGDQSQRLQDKLEIKGPILKGIPESVDVGVPIEFIFEDPYLMVDHFLGADVLQGNGYLQWVQQGNKKYVLFYSDSPSMVVQFIFWPDPRVLYNFVYCSPVEIKINDSGESNMK